MLRPSAGTGDGRNCSTSGNISSEDSSLYTSERILIRPATIADSNILHQWLHEELTAVYRPGMVDFLSTPQIIAQRMAAQETFHPRLELEVMVIHRASGLAIGAMSLANIDHWHQKAELSVMFARGRGTRCSLEAITYAIEQSFTALALHKLAFHTTSRNRLAVRMLQRIEAVPEGVLREELRDSSTLPEKRIDLQRYGLLKQEWQRSRTRSRLLQLFPAIAKIAEEQP